MTLIFALLNKHIPVFFFLIPCSLSFFSFSVSLFLLLSVLHHLLSLILDVWSSFISNCLVSPPHRSLRSAFTHARLSFLNPHMLPPTLLYTPLVACRHLCKSPSCGRRFLWPRPFGSLSLCLLEAVLAHMEKQGVLIQC